MPTIVLRVTAKIATTTRDRISIQRGATSATRERMHRVGFSWNGRDGELLQGDSHSIMRQHQGEAPSRDFFGRVFDDLARTPDAFVEVRDASIVSCPAADVPAKTGLRERHGTRARARGSQEQRSLVKWNGIHPLPDLIVHSDWSGDRRPSHRARKRQTVSAELEAQRYRISLPRPLADVESWLAGLFSRAKAGGAVLAGFDFVIGLPRAYAEAADIPSFVEVLSKLGKEHPWENFLRWNTQVGEVDLHSPLLDWRAGIRPDEEHARRVGLARPDAFFRRCEKGDVLRDIEPAALFRAGSDARQVGKASTWGLREVMQPALLSGAKIWPFHGPLEALVQPGNLTIAETYPREAYGICGIVGQSRKTDSEWRARAAESLLARARDWNVQLDDDLVEVLEQGGRDEDFFDSFVGVLAMIAIVHGHHHPGVPHDDSGISVEGWILGRTVLPEV